VYNYTVLQVQSDVARNEWYLLYTLDSWWRESNFLGIVGIQYT
jgi:hypothetical protein